MTGAGTASLGWKHEPFGSYGESPTDSTFKRFGKNATIEDISIENALEPMRIPEDPEIVDAIKTQFEGAFSANWVVTNPWHLNHVFGGTPSSSGSGPYDYTWSFSPGRFQSMRAYAGVNYLNGTTERQIEGVVGTSYSLTISQGDPVEANLTAIFGSETPNSSFSPDTFGTEPQPLIFHHGDMQLGGTSQTKMQEATLEISPNARFHRGWEQEPVDAVLGGVETSLDITKIKDSTSLRSMTYGSNSGPTTQVSGNTATINLQTPGTSALTFSMSDFTKPDEYGWSDLVDPESDALDETTLTVGAITATATSSESSAL